MNHQLMPGTRLAGRYVIGEVLGQGGFGITYSGEDETARRKVAVKELFIREFMDRNAEKSAEIVLTDEDCREDMEKAKERFLEEARIVGLFHGDPAVISVSDCFQANGTAYIVMNYLEGTTLDRVLRQQERFQDEEIFRRFLPLVRTLRKIHEKHVIHRDISPDNIMVTPSGMFCLLDFGSARDYVSRNTLSRIVKDGYAPVEQWNQDGRQGPWTDVYALCAILYECITGQTPPGSITRMFFDEIRTPSELGISVNPALERILMKGLQVASEDRYQELGSFLKDVDAALEGTSFADRGKGTEGRRLRRPALIGAAVLMVLAGIAGVWKYQEQRRAGETVHGELYIDTDMRPRPTADNVISTEEFGMFFEY